MFSTADARAVEGLTVAGTVFTALALAGCSVRSMRLNPHRCACVDSIAGARVGPLAYGKEGWRWLVVARSSEQTVVKRCSFGI